MVYRGGCGSRLDDEYASPSVTMSDRGRFELEHRGRSDEMAHFVGLDVSVKETSVCVVDAAGTVILEQKVTTEPADIITLLTSLGVSFCRIGIEAGPLSQWLVNAFDGGRSAGDLRGDAAHEGFADGAADQQDGSQRRARDRADDAGRPVQAGACEDASGPGTADAADQPQTASTQAAGPGV